MIIIPTEFKYKVGDKIYIPCTIGEIGEYKQEEILGLIRKRKGLFKRRLVNYYLYQYGFHFYLIEEDKILNLEK